MKRSIRLLFRVNDEVQCMFCSYTGDSFLLLSRVQTFSQLPILDSCMINACLVCICEESVVGRTSSCRDSVSLEKADLLLRNCVD
jgi:hypothetical protein